MPKAGDRGGDCPKCESERVLIGYDDTVLGAYCSTCDAITTVGTIPCTNE